jgi:hypothetical protein
MRNTEVPHLGTARAGGGKWRAEKRQQHPLTSTSGTPISNAKPKAARFLSLGRACIPGLLPAASVPRAASTPSRFCVRLMAAIRTAVAAPVIVLAGCA